MEISHDHQSAVVAAVDVHYLGSGGARAAVVLASDASRGGELIRHFWGEELLYAPCDPGQDSRHNDFIDPLWNLFDFTPEGRGTDWYPS
jgi:predicted dithiol-disulfide oxidoreductase (DUF899 family)